MVQKIKTAFRAKYNKINLSNERLEHYAKKWESKLENEDAIEEFLTQLDVEPLEEIARLDDALRAKPKQQSGDDKTDNVNISLTGDGSVTTVEKKDDLTELKEQIAELRNALSTKQKSDLSTSRSNELKDLPDALKSTLKFVKLEDLSDEDFTALKTDLNTQAESLKVAQSQVNPRFGSQKAEGTLSADEKRYLESKQKKS